MSVTMLHADCMEFMRGQADGAFDLAIVDPPYGIEINMNMGRRAGQMKDHDDKTWDNQAPPPVYFEELMRVSKNQIVWGGNYFPLPLTKAWVFWDKLVPEGVSFADGELAWTSFDKTLVKVTVPYSGFVGSEGKIHPTQKPVALYKWLLTRYAKPGQKIIDTHGGSGSDCIAVHDVNADLVSRGLEPMSMTWMELDADYYAAAVKRYKTHASQLHLIPPVAAPAADHPELFTAEPDA